MSSDHKEVRDIVQVLADKLEICANEGLAAADLLPHGLGIVCYGLRKMSSEHSEVRKVVGALAKIMSSDTCKSIGPLVPNVYCKMLYSLRYMSSNHEEVRNLLQTILPHINATHAHNPGNVEDSLSSAADDVTTIVRPGRQYPKSVNHQHLQVNHQSSRITGKNIGNSFYGLFGFDMRHKEVRMIVTALIARYYEQLPLLDKRDEASILETVKKFEAIIGNRDDSLLDGNEIELFNSELEKFVADVRANVGSRNINTKIWD